MADAVLKNMIPTLTLRQLNQQASIVFVPTFLAIRMTCHFARSGISINFNVHGVNLQILFWLSMLVFIPCGFNRMILLMEYEYKAAEPDFWSNHFWSLGRVGV